MDLPDENKDVGNKLLNSLPYKHMAHGFATLNSQKRIIHDELTSKRDVCKIAIRLQKKLISKYQLL